MAEQTEPSHGLKHGWDLGESGWKEGVDLNWIKIGLTSFLLVLDKDLTTPPGGEAEGDAYIVGPAASGDWSGYDGYIAYFIAGAYRFYQPRLGWHCIVQDENGCYHHNGTNWVAGINLGEAGNLILGDGAGSMIGTSISQKMAFYGSAPIVQQADANQTAVVPDNVDEDIGGLVISATYDQAEVTALRDQCEILADDLRESVVLLNEMRNVLVTLGLMKGDA